MINSKQRAYLRKMANSIECTFQVGKNGVTPEVRDAINESIDKRELLKIHVLENSLLDIKEVAHIVSERTHSDIVQIIGRKIVLYKMNRDNPVIELPKK